jgi:hypothetical protein
VKRQNRRVFISRDASPQADPCWRSPAWDQKSLQICARFGRTRHRSVVDTDPTKRESTTSTSPAGIQLASPILLSAPCAHLAHKAKEIITERCNVPQAAELQQQAHPSTARRCRIVSPITNTSIRVRRKQSSASLGSHTTGSFSLNEVLSTIGTPVSSPKAAMSL